MRYYEPRRNDMAIMSFWRGSGERMLNLTDRDDRMSISQVLVRQAGRRDEYGSSGTLQSRNQLRKPTSAHRCDSVVGNINKRLIGQWIKPHSVAFIARGFAGKRDAFILVRLIVFPKLAFCDSLA